MPREGVFATNAARNLAGFFASQCAVIEKQSTNSTRKGGKRPGAGRPKGALEKGNAALREMILHALDDAGGVQYLQRTAESHPGAFLSLLGRVLPTTLAGDAENPLTINWPVAPPAIER